MAVSGAILGGYLGSGTAVGIAGGVGLGAAGGALASGISGTAPITDPTLKGLGLGVKPSTPPQQIEQPQMPVIDDAAVAQARRRAITASLSRRGRRSTILTDPLGGSQEFLG